MRKSLWLVPLAVLILGVTLVQGINIRGTVRYEGTWPADSMIWVLAIPDSFSISDPMAFISRVGMVGIAQPDTYLVTGDSLTGTYWYVMAVSGTATMPDIFSGAKCGASPANPFTLTDGEASGIDVTVANTGSASGTIRNVPSGGASNLKLKIHDVYSEINFPGFGSTDHQYINHPPSDWSISEIHSGPKRFIAFIDENGSDSIDAGEDSCLAVNSFGNVYIVGGGPEVTGVVCDFEGSGVGSQPRIVTAGCKVSPNPATDRVEVPFHLYRSAASTVHIRVLDMAGRCLQTADVPATYGLNKWVWNSSAAPAGVYDVKLSAGSQTASERVVITR